MTRYCVRAAYLCEVVLRPRGHWRISHGSATTSCREPAHEIMHCFSAPGRSTTDRRVTRMLGCCRVLLSLIHDKCASVRWGVAYRSTQ